MRRGLVRLAALLPLVSPLVAAPASSASQPGPGIAEKLSAIHGLTVLREEPSGIEGYRFFHLSFKQRADHRNPQRGAFEQRLTLMHRSENSPTVQHLSSYQLTARPFLSDPASLIKGNQVHIEHRYFGSSRPKSATPRDWARQLTIWQAATDSHRIIQALRTVYGGKWLNTGRGKGGMSTVYHRRFYPADVSGTIAYIAVNDVLNEDDSACRTAPPLVRPQRDEGRGPVGALRRCANAVHLRGE